MFYLYRSIYYPPFQCSPCPPVAIGMAFWRPFWGFTCTCVIYGEVREGRALHCRGNPEPLRRGSDKLGGQKDSCASVEASESGGQSQGGLWHPQSSHMTSAPMMSLYADASVQIEYVHEEGRLKVLYKQRIIVHVWEALWSGFREHRGTLWKLQQEVSSALTVIDRLVMLTFFFFPPLTLSLTVPHKHVTLSTSSPQGRKKLFFISAQSLYIEPKKAQE